MKKGAFRNRVIAMLLCAMLIMGGAMPVHAEEEAATQPETTVQADENQTEADNPQVTVGEEETDETDEAEAVKNQESDEADVDEAEKEETATEDNKEVKEAVETKAIETKEVTEGTPVAVPTEKDWEISKSKTATQLDENFESKVTLSLPSSQKPVEFDVMFVLDKSKSTDKAEISKAVEELFEKIKGSKGTVNIGVVTFNKLVDNYLELTELKKENLKTIQDAITYSSSSGTNIHAGLLKGMELLNEGNAEQKYLILVSDGITYLYNDEEGNGPKAISNHGQASPDDYAGKYGNTNAPDDWKEYLDGISALVDADGTTYEGTYISWNNIEGASKGLYGGGGYGMDALEDHAMTVDKALLRTYDAYVEATNNYGKDHVYAIGRENPSYPWAGSFMDYLSGISANEQDINNIITNDIYYLLAAGSRVEDYIGYVKDDYNFDFVNDASKLTMKVGDKVLPAVKIAENQYGFGGSGDKYDYEVEYVPGNKADEEHFVWHINVPVSNFEPVSLTYTVKLVNPKTEAGTYGQYDADGSNNYAGLYTNNSATLYPVDSNNHSGDSETFNKPTVSYTVEKDIVGEPGESIDNEEPAEEDDSNYYDEETDETGKGSKSVKTVKTGDSSNVMLWIFVLAGAGCIAVSSRVYGKRKRR